MPTCANCQNDAIYTYAVSANYLIHYCQYHLPRFLTNQKNAGQLPLVVEAAPVEAPVEEVVEEPVVEEVPAAPTGTSKKSK